jgi:PLD-like domain
MKIVRSPWTNRFESLVGDAVNDLVISSPFVSGAACERLTDCVDRKGRCKSLRLTLVTNLCLDNLVSRVTNVTAIVELAQRLPLTSVRFIPTLHAKVYVADTMRAIISSANLTDGGMYRNLEYGVEVDDPVTVQEIRKDVEDYAALGPLVPVATLVSLADAANRVVVQRQIVEQEAAREVRTTLRELLQTADDTVLKARTAGKSLTAILQATIVYLLSRSPMTTPEIHARVQQIHPDLCDDTVDRVIDGRSYGKRWKHSVRTAQSHLKEQGVAVLENGVWRLVTTNSGDQVPTPRS